MKILLYSGAFFPSMGGIETGSAMFAEGFVEKGHEVTLATRTPSSEEDSYSYPVVRQPSRSQLYSLVKEADVVFSNGASLVPVPYCALLGKPFVWTHQGYQILCIDGLGWNMTEATPRTPLASIRYWMKQKGFLYGLKEGMTLLVRNRVARHFAYNVACSAWIYKRLDLKPPDVTIINRLDHSTFRKTRDIKAEKEFDFVFLGRLSGEKGVDTLLRATGILHRKHEDWKPSVLLIGEGFMKEALQAIAREEGIEDYVTYAGKAFGDSLNELLAKARIGVMPSIWEEAYGAVTLEMFTAGLPVIHSERCGPASVVNDEYWTFDNGNEQALSEKMEEIHLALLENKDMIDQKIDSLLARVEDRDVAQEYLDFFQSILENR